MKYICCWSGGKDSTASIILFHQKYPDIKLTILFAEVMFDKRNNISGENPEHIHFIKHVAKPLFESWGYEVKILRAEKDYLDVFYHVIVRPTKHFEHKGMKYGFCASGQCSVKRDCKEKPINDYLQSIKEPYMQLVGIGIDEPKRLESMHKNPTKISVLEECGYTTGMARELCIEHGLYSPSYKYSKRGGCWMCPNAKYEEHKSIAEAYPDAWDKFVAMEQEPGLAHPKWNIYGKSSLKERNELIKNGYFQLELKF